MAFSIDHTGPPRRRFACQVRRRSDGHYWHPAGGWASRSTFVAMAERSAGRYGLLLPTTDPADRYDVLVVGGVGGVVKQYACDATGRTGPPPPKPRRAKPMKLAIVGGVMQVDGRPQRAEVVLQALSSNGITVYTAVRWGPSALTSCNCPGWTTAAANRGKDIAARSCKHTKQVAGMATSVYLQQAPIPPPPPPPFPGDGVRTGRGIDLG